MHLIGGQHRAGADTRAVAPSRARSAAISSAADAASKVISTQRSAGITSSSTSATSFSRGSMRRRTAISRCFRIESADAAVAQVVHTSRIAPPARQTGAQVVGGDLAWHATGGCGHGRGSASSLAHRHARRHRARRGVRVVRRRKTAATDEQPVEAARHKRSIRNAIHRATGNVLPVGLAARPVVLYRRAAECHLVGKAARLEHVGARQLVVTDHASRLAHADRRARPDEHRTLEAGHPVAQEAVVLADLPAALDLGPRQRDRVRRVNVGDARHMDHHHAVERGAVPRPLEPRQVIPAATAACASVPTAQASCLRGALDVDVREPEQRRERLHPALCRGVL